jgi:L-serine dehydratase
MFLSVFDLFKIGIGPSSSHTMGPMSAAGLFLDSLRARGAGDVSRLRCTLHGSLAFTGKGHGTDRAVILGLMGCTPDTIDPDMMAEVEADVRRDGTVSPPGFDAILFEPDRDLIFNYDQALPGHANGMALAALDTDGGVLMERIYYSIGGGFVVEENELEAAIPEEDAGANKREAGYPYPFGNADEMIAMSDKSGLSLVEMKRANEGVLRSPEDLNAGLDAIWDAMRGCMERGLRMEGELPGGLFVKRRAKNIRDMLIEEHGSNQPDPYAINEWLSVYAMAVNEENAAGGRVVTAPTNGAAGVVPAVIRWYFDHHPGATNEGVRDFLLAAAAIGGLIKHNASISGAEVGCQGEVGSASAMAAAGLTAVRGGTVRQIENAAEIALEHHLGMTCDPVGGLVQVPCIERNGFGAVKAVTASSLALRGDGTHFVSLDQCVETMRQTGIDLSEKYKETSQGGLAVTLAAC